MVWLELVNQRFRVVGVLRILVIKPKYIKVSSGFCY